MKEIVLTHRKIALVDDEDYDLLNKNRWYVDNINRVQTNLLYAVRCLPKEVGKSRKTLRMHRVIMNVPEGLEVDHLDGNGLNNQKLNLRIVCRRENCQNLHIVKSSKYPGVSWHCHPGLMGGARGARPWVARIRVGGVQKILGSFKTEGGEYGAYEVAVDRLNRGLDVNSVTPRRTKSSRFKGVYKINGRNRWESTVRVDGKTKYLGSFKNEVEAHEAYCKAVEDLKGGKA